MNIGQTVESSTCSVLCRNKECQGLNFLAEQPLAGMACLDMLMKFVVSISKEEDPDDKLFQKNRAPSNFHNIVAYCINR
jgi:hypothetical protein